MKKILPWTIAAFPFAAFGAAADENLFGILGVVDQLLNAIIPILMILAAVVFLWGVITYITAGGEEEKIKAGRSYMIYGIIAIFVMVAFWGIVKFLVNTFNVGGETGCVGPGCFG